MKYRKVLLTGASGKLGQAIQSSQSFPGFLTFSLDSFELTKPETIDSIFFGYDFDAVIHCAALARMSECEKNPQLAITTNIIGTANLVNAVLAKEQRSAKSIRFIQISTDGVYAGTNGNYSEQSATIPYNKYGWTKLGAECAVNLLNNFCIIRTSFFDPQDIRFAESATDSYSSKLPILELVENIAIMLNNEFVGTVNIGGPKLADFDRYLPFKPELKPCKYQDIQAQVGFQLAQDSSLDYTVFSKFGGLK